MTRERDAETVRRALRAGLSVWVASSAVLLGAVLVAGGSGRAGAVAVTAGFLLGAIVCSGWLLLSALLDLFANERPGARRMWWTAAAVLVAFVSPMCVLGAQGAGAG